MKSTREQRVKELPIINYYERKWEANIFDQIKLNYSRSTNVPSLSRDENRGRKPRKRTTKVFYIERICVHNCSYIFYFYNFWWVFAVRSFEMRTPEYLNIPKRIPKNRTWKIDGNSFSVKILCNGVPCIRTAWWRQIAFAYSTGGKSQQQKVININLPTTTFRWWWR